MDDNEKNAPQKPSSDKKLRLDLSEAWVQESDDDDDDIIELKDEVKLEQGPNDDRVDLIEDRAPGRTFDEPATGKIIALEEETDDQEGVIRLDADLSFEEQDEEETDESRISPPDSERPLKADNADDVVEITEFDDVLSEDNDAPVTLSDVDEELDPEEEFLELIDVEEDDPEEESRDPDMGLPAGQEEIEDEIIQFDGPGDDVEDVELEDFIKDSLGEDLRIDDEFEDELDDALGIDTESEMELADPSSDAEEFDFSMGPSEISEKIDRLDTIFFEDAELENKLEEDEAEAETVEVAESDIGDEPDQEDQEVPSLENSEEPQVNSEHAALLNPSQDQIEKSIERVIQKNFSDKIESMIREIIEEAVSKEIDRLKNILLEDDSAQNG